MKKFLLLLVCCLAVIGLAGCGKNKVVGEWQFSEMTMTMGATTTTIKAGESYMGVTLNADYITVVFEKGGNGKIVTKMGDESMEQAFSWEYVDKAYKLTPVDAEEGDEAITMSFDGDYLVMSQEGMTMKLSKK